LGVPRQLVRSPAYRQASLTLRCLLIELQDVYCPDKPIHYSTRRAAEALCVSKETAARAFKEGVELGFLRVANESDWLNGKARDWILTWMQLNGNEPTCDWLVSTNKLGPTSHQKDGRGPKRLTSRTVGQNDQGVQDMAADKNSGLGELVTSVFRKSVSPEGHH
jgi:hypothetical protein